MMQCAQQTSPDSSIWKVGSHCIAECLTYIYNIIVHHRLTSYLLFQLKHYFFPSIKFLDTCILVTILVCYKLLSNSLLEALVRTQVSVEGEGTLICCLGLEWIHTLVAIFARIFIQPLWMCLNITGNCGLQPVIQSSSSTNHNTTTLSAVSASKPRAVNDITNMTLSEALYSLPLTQISTYWQATYKLLYGSYTYNVQTVKFYGGSKIWIFWSNYL